MYHAVLPGALCAECNNHYMVYCIYVCYSIFKGVFMLFSITDFNKTYINWRNSVGLLVCELSYDINRQDQVFRKFVLDTSRMKKHVAARILSEVPNLRFGNEIKDNYWETPLSKPALIRIHFYLPWGSLNDVYYSICFGRHYNFKNLNSCGIWKSVWFKFRKMFQLWLRVN